MPALVLVLVVAAAPGGASVDAASLLRTTARGADQLQVVTDDGPDGPGGQVLLEVRDAAAIAKLLALLDTEPVNPKRGIHHLCVGWPITVISRGGREVARFSFDHEEFLRPHDSLWPWDAVVRPKARRPIAQWYADRGLATYLSNLTEVERKATVLEAFFRAFPPQFQKVLRTQRDQPLPAAALARIAAETPSEQARFELICRGLSTHPEEIGLSFEHQTLFAVAAALSPRALTTALLAVTTKGPLADGAARLVFDASRDDQRLMLSRMSPTEAQAVVAKLAPVFLASDRHFSLDALPLELDEWWSPRLEAVWHAEVGQLGNRPRVSCWRTPAPLGAAVALAARGRLSDTEFAGLTRASSECEQDTATVKLIRFLRTGQLPTADDVKRANSDVQEVFVKRLSLRTDWAAIDLGVSLVEGAALWSLQPWLGQWVRPGQTIEPTYELGQEITAWWAKAKASYPLPAP